MYISEDVFVDICEALDELIGGIADGEDSDGPAVRSVLVAAAIVAKGRGMALKDSTALLVAMLAPEEEEVAEEGGRLYH